MPFRMINQCTDCNEIVEDCYNHDCPNDPMKDPVKRAKAEEWENKLDHLNKIWEDWAYEGDDIKYAIPSIDHYPEEVAVHGECVLTLHTDEFWGAGEAYVSGILTNPTWGEVLKCFDEAIKTTGDYHHCFLEGLVVPQEPEGEIVFIEFATGS